MSKTKKETKNEIEDAIEEIEELESEGEEISSEEMEEPVELEEIEEADEAEEESVEDQIARLQEESAEYLDGWQRARAEFANYKKRIEREREDARERITGEVITRYLGIVDDLERALNEPIEDEDIEKWVEGVELIYQKFIAILENEGVEPIEPENVPFDPNFHEAVTFEDDDDYDGGYVIDFTQRGYKMGDRVLRPALVRVAK